MAKETLISQGNYTPPPGEEMDPESKTEQGGYLTTKMQVDRMLMAGERLFSFKKGFELIFNF